MFVAVALGECIASIVGVDWLFLEVFIERTILVVGRVIFIAENTPHIPRALLARTLARRVVTSTFHTPRLEKAIVLVVPISLTNGTLGDIL
jgi:hypothetical protein